MPIITLESSERSKRKRRSHKNIHAFGNRHGKEFWEDEKKQNNFGLKYMNKYGWNTGDGLGKHKQGKIKHIKTKYKNDNKGIGCKSNPNNTMFQATMFMFNDILSSLNNKNKDKKPINEHLSTSALIKSYEAKHHLYGRFRAAKEIKNRSETDKNEIFGVTDNDNNDNSGFTEDDQTAYAQHLNSLANMRSGKMGLGFTSNNHNHYQKPMLTFGKFTKSGIITKHDLFNDNDANNANNSDDIEKKSKKKKKKKKKKQKQKQKLAQDVDQDDMNIIIHEPIQCDLTVKKTEKTKTKKKKKKKKKNKKRKFEDIKCNENDMSPPLKKLKLDLNDNVSDVSSTASILSSIPTTPYSNSSNGLISMQNGNDIDINVDKTDKKKKKKQKKKKKKKKQTQNVMLVDECEENKSKKMDKKSKKKKKDKKKKKKKDENKSNLTG